MKQLQTKKPWMRLPGESDTAYHRFSIYLQMGPERSISKVAERLGKSRGYEKHIARWSSKFSWVGRVAEYDQHLVMKLLENKEQLLDQGRARLFRMMDKALDELESVLDEDNVINVGEGRAHIITQKLKAVDSVLNRIGLVEQKAVVQEEPKKEEDNIFVFLQQLNQQIIEGGYLEGTEGYDKVLKRYHEEGGKHITRADTNIRTDQQ